VLGAKVKIKEKESIKVSGKTTVALEKYFQVINKYQLLKIIKFWTLK
jgi:hypothetical protein